MKYDSRITVNPSPLIYVETGRIPLQVLAVLVLRIPYPTAWRVKILAPGQADFLAPIRLLFLRNPSIRPAFVFNHLMYRPTLLGLLEPSLRTDGANEGL